MAATSKKRYWLMKCEPSAYTIDDLERDGTTSWEGVRNYQARNFMRDEMKVGDLVLFYASNAKPSGVTGIARIVREGYPDSYATQKGHRYYDPDSRPDAPTWYMVDVGFVENFHGTIPLETLKQTQGLERMMVTQKGSRLSVQPVRPEEFEIVLKLARSGAVVPASGDTAPVSKPTRPTKAGSAGRATTASSSKKKKATGARRPT
ncbi:MAG: EVE domain-containing protein [Acidobacteriota bacterium]|jgi:predicted RNA-binding protein with PUA-like domain|nr:MAG: EVE domain-containing protein [Acidobacteriota bacterium]